MVTLAAEAKQLTLYQQSSTRITHQVGFTLIELMIVVAIIGVLAAIAYPSYQGYIEQTNRVEMMSEMQHIANRIESNKINYKRYDRIPLSSVLSGVPATDGSVSFPSPGNSLYTVTVTSDDNITLRDKDWTITAAPVIGQRMANDGSLTLDSTGKKCRDTYCGTGSEWK